jgi:hypothetical protein
MSDPAAHNMSQKARKMTHTVMIAALLFVALPSWAAVDNNTVGSAGAGCQPYEVAVALLRDKYDETLQGRGLMSRGSVRVVLELWSNMTTGSWTAIRVLPNGCTQPVQSGTGWHVPLVEPRDDDA